jgi:hypothetical protein
MRRRGWCTGYRSRPTEPTSNTGTHANYKTTAFVHMRVDVVFVPRFVCMRACLHGDYMYTCAVLNTAALVYIVCEHAFSAFE